MEGTITHIFIYTELRGTLTAFHRVEGTLTHILTHIELRGRLTLLRWRTHSLSYSHT